ncbi:hypothetical protein BEN49_20525 [Hymenobacter coccineus]|uniref:DUF2809 domain-containing protein n=1 Tax=Hymenobacter coccineus TaxID=1908235 RepID=A0A1G1TK73_9BACT|nr:hypothetical protein BEN49_20525 [Hymenobacter coccineus]
MLVFRRGYFLLASLLFGVEAAIAAFAHDALLRPYGGDLLATVMLYCLLRSFWAAPAAHTIWAALLISYGIEAAQAAHLLAHLGLAHSAAARLVLGSQFEWGDVLAYTLGALLVAGVERRRATRTA